MSSEQPAIASASVQAHEAGKVKFVSAAGAGMRTTVHAFCVLGAERGKGKHKEARACLVPCVWRMRGPAVVCVP